MMKLSVKTVYFEVSLLRTSIWIQLQRDKRWIAGFFFFFYVPSKPFRFLPAWSITPSIGCTPSCTTPPHCRCCLFFLLEGSAWTANCVRSFSTLASERLPSSACCRGFEKLPRTPVDPRLQFSCRKIRGAFFSAAWSSFCPSVKELKVKPLAGFRLLWSPSIWLPPLLLSCFFFSSYSDQRELFKSSLYFHSKCFPKASVSSGGTSLTTFGALFGLFVRLGAEEPPDLWGATVWNQIQLRGQFTAASSQILSLI